MPVSNIIGSPLTKPHAPKVKLAAQKMIVDRFLDGGMSQQAFCELHNLNKSTFKNWVFRHKPGPQPQNLQPVFLPISLDAVDEKEKDEMDNHGVRVGNFVEPNVIEKPNLARRANVVSAPSPIERNCDRLTIACARLSIGVPVGFDTKYLGQVLAIMVDL